MNGAIRSRVHTNDTIASWNAQYRNVQYRQVKVVNSSVDMAPSAPDITVQEDAGTVRGADGRRLSPKLLGVNETETVPSLSQVVQPPKRSPGRPPGPAPGARAAQWPTPNATLSKGSAAWRVRVAAPSAWGLPRASRLRQPAAAAATAAGASEDCHRHLRRGRSCSLGWFPPRPPRPPRPTQGTGRGAQTAARQPDDAAAIRAEAAPSSACRRPLPRRPSPGPPAAAAAAPPHRP